ncbi:ABC transporter substrate-binding protein [Marivivens niveibacter]|nr:ABC transporter substrate-binding protein [Marivivens niveibacter]
MKGRTHISAAIFAALWGTSVLADVDVTIGYLSVITPPPPTLSRLDEIPENLGSAGAITGIEDNQTTGRFLNHNYSLNQTAVDIDGDYLAAAADLLAASPYLVIDAPMDALIAIADLPSAQGAMLFNASAQDQSLRSTDCRANLLHTIPSNAMETDALAQLFVSRRWDDIVMIAGTYPADTAYAEAMRNSVRKFGMRMGDEKTWAFDADMRRAASAEVPLFTQDFGDYDVMVVADEVHDFGRYILYNTWEPRPVAGSEGLTATAWAPVIEQWGAAQLQSRFTEAHDRAMAPVDYAAWAAVRTVGEAVTRTNSGDFDTLRAYILSDDFELAGFKGRPLTYRAWNGQLRQPIAIAHPRALVATAPLDGFLHHINELDSLGLDRPESQCEAFE